jgi:hypothetical protein
VLAVRVGFYGGNPYDAKLRVAGRVQLELRAIEQFSVHGMTGLKTNRIAVRRIADRLKCAFDQHE